MSWFIVVVLLTISSSVSRIRTEEIRDVTKAQAPVHMGEEVMKALTVQRNSHFNSDLNDTNIYGTVEKMENNTYISGSRRQSSSTQTRTATAFGDPGHERVSYVRSDYSNYQRQPNQEQTLTKGPESVWNSNTFLSGNNFNSAPDGNIRYGYTEESNQIYKLQNGNNQTQPTNIGLKLVSILTNSNSQASGGMEINADSRTFHQSSTFNFEKSSVTGNYTKNSKDINTQNVKKIQLNTTKFNEPNRQTCLSSSNFYTFLYFFVILLKYYAY